MRCSKENISWTDAFKTVYQEIEITNSASQAFSSQSMLLFRDYPSSEILDILDDAKRKLYLELERAYVLKVRKIDPIGLALSHVLSIKLLPYPKFRVRN